MPNWTGYFNSTGSPSVKLSIGGVFPELKQEFEAIVDTGFSGFVSMPLVRAFPLGLLLFGTTSLVLADGSTSFRLTAWGHVRVGDEDQTGVIVLQNNSDEILVGMELLKKFSKELRVSAVGGHVLLVDSAIPLSSPSAKV